jgi:CDP-ribitol ribitolphosphotransferase
MYNDYQSESYVSVVKSFMRFMKLYANARYVFICDNFLPVSSCTRRAETQVIQLWHGGGLLKKTAYDTVDDIPKYYKGNVFKNYTLMTVSASICEPVITRSHRQEDGVVKATGLSRCDSYFDDTYVEKCKKKFYKEHPDAVGKKILMWAPTFRGKPLDPYVIGSEEIEELKKKLGDEWYVVIKMHPHVDAKKQQSNSKMAAERILPMVDVLITDYSSIIFDYSIFRKPMVLYVPDYEEYTAERGLYIDMKDIPAAMVTEGSALYEAVLNEYSGYDKDKLEEFYKTYMGACDGHATERILKEIGAEGYM